MKYEWQPIKTAPYDTPILVCLISYNKTPIISLAKKESWISGDVFELNETGSYAGDGLLYGEPTHWMPLPPPPTI